MSFLAAIRNSVNGTTLFFQKEVKNRWSFLTLFFVTSGVVQLLTVFVFFFVYSNLINEQEQRYFKDSLYSLNGGGLTDYVQFVGLYMLLFLVVLIKKSGGSRAESLSFGSLFQQIKLQTFVLYFLSVVLTLAGVIYIMNSIESQYGPPLADSLSQLLYYVEAEWYETVLKQGGLYLIKFLPAFVVGYYLIYLKEGNWRWEYIWSYRKQVCAVFILVLAFSGLTESISQFVTDIIFGTLFEVIQNPTLVLLIGLVISKSGRSWSCGWLYSRGRKRGWMALGSRIGE
jgi:hypothetical protein